MTAISNLWRENPVLVKELRVRMRGARAYWIIAGYLLFLSLILFSYYAIWWNQARSSGVGLSAGSKVGQEFFTIIVVTQAFLVAFITPAITSGAITIEREQRTLEMLSLTRLSTGAIVAGKLMSAVGFVSLLVISSLPLASICFFLGGVAPEQIAWYTMLLIAGSFVMGALGLAWSSVAKSTALAVVLTYSTVLAPFAGAIVYAMIAGGAWDRGMDNTILAAAAAPLFGFPNPSPDWGVDEFFRQFDGSHVYGLILPSWLPALSTYSLLGLLLAAVAAVRLRAKPEEKGWLLRLLVAAFLAQQMFFFFGARFSAHAPSAPATVQSTLAARPLVFALAYPVFLLLLMVPIFSTGVTRPGEARHFRRVMLRGWTLAGLKEARLASGLPFLCLLALLILGMYALSFVFVGRTGALSTGVIAPAGAVDTSVQSLGAIAVALFASVVGLYALGVLFSLMTRSRWAALMLSYGALAAILIVPPTTLGTWRGGGSEGAPGMLINLFYLNPLMTISQAGEPEGFWNRLPLLASHSPMWVMALFFHLLLAGLCLVLAPPLLARIAASRAVD